MAYVRNEHRPPGCFIAPNVGDQLSPTFSSFCRSGCERSEFPDKSFSTGTLNSLSTCLIKKVRFIHIHAKAVCGIDGDIESSLIGNSKFMAI